MDQHNLFLLTCTIMLSIGIHNVVRTKLCGGTEPISITYPGPIDVTSDLLHYYVLDKDNNRNVKYLNTSHEKLGSITNSSSKNDLVIGFSKLCCNPCKLKESKTI